ncbi:class II fructose-1,6-bisphosphate aldolase [candidate division WOR-3 bacterium]|nr:class II fructose-1,6-bisphosphate aldolase [candidate division WOR-3 bacterium]
MSLVPGRELLAAAGARGHAVGAFNFNNLEFLRAIVAAADARQTPVFLATSEGAIGYAGIEYIVAMARAAAETTGVPLCLHLDHGKDLALIERCIKAGYTSVMIDASRLPFDENLEQTRAVVAMAHPAGVSVEAELGRLVGREDNVAVAERDALLVDPDEAARFVTETGVDSLAPAIGTAHGAFKFKGEPKLDFERLAKVKRLTGGLPLVLHGASSVPPELVEKCGHYGLDVKGARGVPEPDLVRAIGLGVNKINVDTDLRLAFAAEVRHAFAEQPRDFDPRHYLGRARDAVTNLVEQKIELFSPTS